jgi:adenylate cyclase
MKESPVREALRGIQALVAEATGAPLQGEAASKLQALLAGLGGPAVPSQQIGNFLSREVTILLADLRGFTTVAAKHPPDVVLEMLNRYLVRMSGIIYGNGGSIDKFMGDAIMVLFGAPITHADDVHHAVTCAVQMQIAMEELNRDHRERALPELFMGIGINTGTVLAGLLGSEAYSEYTVIGDEVNLASRIEAFSLRGQVLVSENTYRLCSDFIETEEALSVQVKGKTEPVLLREVRGIPSLGLQVPRAEIRRSPRVEVTIPFTFRRVENKIVLPAPSEGTTRDLSYHGLLAELGEPVAPMTDLRLELDLSLLGRKSTEVYAKVLKSFVVDGRHLSGIEFTSADATTSFDIQRFVQLLLQGSSTR